jgi:hypothetical protein
MGWTLTHGDATVARLELRDTDMPWFICDMRREPGFELQDEVHAVLMRTLKGRPAMSDLFGRGGRVWLAALELPADEREPSTGPCASLRQIDDFEAATAHGLSEAQRRGGCSQHGRERRLRRTSEWRFPQTGHDDGRADAYPRAAVRANGPTGGKE